MIININKESIGTKKPQLLPIPKIKEQVNIKPNKDAIQPYLRPQLKVTIKGMVKEKTKLILNSLNSILIAQKIPIQATIPKTRDNRYLQILLFIPLKH